MSSSQSDADNLIPFSDAVKLEKLGPHAYRANLRDTFLIGTVPNGGYVSSCLLQAASLSLASKGQPHPLIAHFEFLGRTEVGPAVINVEVVKPGRNLSTVHVTLYQDGLLPNAPWVTLGSSRKLLVAYMTMADVRAERGLSLDTGFSLQPQPPSRPDFVELVAGQESHWEEYNLIKGNPVGQLPSLQNLRYYAPRQGQPSKSITDLWIRLTAGGKFTNSSLGYVIDCLPYPVEAYRPTEEGQEGAPFAIDRFFWYPTLVMNLDLKKALPEDGVEWLQLRIQSKQIRNGRFDLEVLVMDAEGDLVALGHHVNMIVGLERNMAGRKSHI